MKLFSCAAMEMFVLLFFFFCKIFELSWLLFFWAPALSRESSIRICDFSKIIFLPRMPSCFKLFCHYSLLTFMTQRMYLDRLSKTSESDRTTLEFSWSRAASALDEMYGEKEFESGENIYIFVGIWNFLIPRERRNFLPSICDAHWHKTVKGAVGSY